MSYQEDRLKRAELKYIGLYLLEDATPGRDKKEKELREEAYSMLTERMEGVGEERAEKIREAAIIIDSVGEQVGFFSGVKVGARLILNLLDGGEIVF